ncbi:glycosyltransferase family 2 protein [Helicobacter aurati]|uniref:glycosyltransferase family 2 protein n=1 Tax=Helicobacter aurati TaxID=137778 RepID=UPI002278FE7A|nr:glycosyltransferase [Helicobacter aurati]
MNASNIKKRDELLHEDSGLEPLNDERDILMPTLCLVVPAFNEEKVLAKTLEVLLSKLQHLIEEKYITKQSMLLVVDDGSNDATWEILKNSAKLFSDSWKDNNYQRIQTSCPPPPVLLH